MIAISGTAVASANRRCNRQGDDCCKSTTFAVTIILCIDSSITNNKHDPPGKHVKVEDFKSGQGKVGETVFLPLACYCVQCDVNDAEC